jgi:hypothetical protein
VCYRDASYDRRPATLVSGSRGTSGGDGSRRRSSARTASRERRWHLATGAPGNGDTDLARGASSGRVRGPHYSLHKMRSAYAILVGNAQGKVPCWRPRHILVWERNIKMDVSEQGMGVRWINLHQGKIHWRTFVSTIMNLEVP